MNRTSTTLVLIAAAGLTASGVAGPSPAFTLPAERATSLASVKSEPPAAEAGAVVKPGAPPALAPEVFLVWRGAPKSLSAGFTYVDAAGHELSKSHQLALEKATANALAAAAREPVAKQAAGIGQ